MCLRARLFILSLCYIVMNVIQECGLIFMAGGTLFFDDNLSFKLVILGQNNLECKQRNKRGERTEKKR